MLLWKTIRTFKRRRPNDVPRRVLEHKIDTPPVLRVPKEGALQRQAELDVQIAGIEKRIAVAVSRIKYVDPAALTPPPEPEVKEVIWFEDGFPKGKIEATGPPLKLVTREEGPVFGGKLAT